MTRRPMTWTVKSNPGTTLLRLWVPRTGHSRLWLTRISAWARLFGSLCLLEPLVAVAWAHAFSVGQGVAPTLAQVAILGFGFWLTYTADHLMDAGRANGSALLTARHAFAASYTRGLAAIWIVALIAALVTAASSLSLEEWCGGLAVATLALAYLFGVQRRRCTRFRMRERGAKELAVCVIFAAGTTLFLWTNGKLDLPHLLANVLFALLVLQNLMTIAFIERHVDRYHDTPSVATRLLHSNRAPHIYGVTLVCLSCLLFAASSHHSPAAPLYLGVAVASLGLMLVLRLPRAGIEAKHLLADVAVLVGALPALLGA